ncbi:MAG: hypothetical protein AVDCRST_MAG08-2853, partial [uncultured Acetobacteraceae bacterium]
WSALNSASNAVSGRSADGSFSRKPWEDRMSYVDGFVIAVPSSN